MYNHKYWDKRSRSPRIDLSPDPKFIAIKYEYTNSMKENHSVDQFINRSPLHVLLIEDNLVALRLIEIIASQAGLSHSSSVNAEKAMILTEESSFDFIITDLSLPGISGYEFTQNLRQSNNQNQSIPIFGLTASHLAEVRKRCLEVGMNSVLPKPISHKMMNDLIIATIQFKKDH